MKNCILSFLCLFLFLAGVGQNNDQKIPVLKYTGQLLDVETQVPLAYAHVAILGTKLGAVTNDQGYFTITSNQLSDDDTLSFYFVGYQTKKMSAAGFRENPKVMLKSETFSLKEFFVFAETKNAEDIVKSVLLNRDKNYKTLCSKSQIFTRDRYVSDITNIDIHFKKSSFQELNEKMTKLVERKIPKHAISYTDFLGDAYLSDKVEDSLKLNPIKVVSLKDKDLADINQIEDMFEKMFANTKEEEYWKIKSGIIGSNVDIEDNTEADKDSLSQQRSNRMNTYYARRLDKVFESAFSNKKKWEFLYHTNRYNYELVFGTVINGEQVYVIDFTPKNKGEYAGRLYVSTETYALIKANFGYAPGKIGTNIKLFGIGYTENVSEIDVYYEKRNGAYFLKYFSKKGGSKFSFDRNLALVKKKKRFLVDKKMNEIKVRLKLNAKEVGTYEILVVDSKKISKKEYNTFKQKPNFKTVYVDQFSDHLWKDYTIIEPSKQMRDYKKIE